MAKQDKLVVRCPVSLLFALSAQIGTRCDCLVDMLTEIYRREVHDERRTVTVIEFYNDEGGRKMVRVLQNAVLELREGLGQMNQEINETCMRSLSSAKITPIWQEKGGDGNG